MWQHNVYYVCVTFSVVRYVGLFNPLSHALNRHTVRLFTESDDTRGCNNTICPPEDEQSTAQNMLRIIM